jgi:hypothetical protein
MTDHLIREAPCTVRWSFPGSFYSLSFAKLAAAEEAFNSIISSATVVSASLWRRGECLRQYDYDPYAWHDVRKAVGR